MPLALAGKMLNGSGKAVEGNLVVSMQMKSMNQSYRTGECEDSNIIVGLWISGREEHA
jgi:hypothetical protein